jgi:hypothetical protein
MSIVLNATTMSLQLVLASAEAANKLAISAKFTDTNNTSGVTTPGVQDSVSNGVTPVTIVAAPASNHTRTLTDLVVENLDTASAVLTVSLNNNSVLTVLTAQPLAPGQQAIVANAQSWGSLWGNGSGWTIVNASLATIAGTVQTGPGARTALLTSTAVNIAASGDNTVIAASGSTVIRVYRLEFLCNGAVNVITKDVVNNITSEPVQNFASGGGKILDYDGEPWYTTAAGGSFGFNLSGAVQVSGRVWYTQA